MKEEKGWANYFCNHYFFGSPNLYNNGEVHPRFLEDLTLYIQRFQAFLNMLQYLAMEVSIMSMPLHCVSFSCLFGGTCVSCNGHENHGITCATTFRICNYEF